MASHDTVRRRWVAALLVAVALAMLVAGQTLLAGRLGPLGFGLYWLACLLTTALAIVVALRDLRAVQRGHLEEQQRLFKATLDQIADDARAKAQRQTRSNHKPSERRQP